MRPLINAFARGMADLIDPKWLGLFNAKEFNQVRYCFFEYLHIQDRVPYVACILRMVDYVVLRIST